MAQVKIDVTKISVEPNMCPLESEIKLCIDFNAEEKIADSWWDVVYVVGQGAKCHVIPLGSTERTHLSSGANQALFSAPSISVKGVKASLLCNSPGLIKAILKSGDGEVIEISLVTMVSKCPDGTLSRNIMNPLE
mmetsp:Transcript_50734/g.99408  ORF Transcript_50734/g.99408 Transcript_50734/m.99408 type:complete len:135 (+) Transcript_50734:49-453(+)|eukprot:CAMPEP_0175094950 /NCGR_PEP_ID=MMETSP0086_2-20121207/3879_1 /TAXON_ID=136419 /ORGANISM="Unknown Unknown, Strain D1" /LENGTH=134 /DNA_ID=CAMNT_0016368133 /DNA_START=48 /DNA_END=452 /DNA_ORIENTATION=-